MVPVARFRCHGGRPSVDGMSPLNRRIELFPQLVRWSRACRIAFRKLLWLPIGSGRLTKTSRRPTDGVLPNLDQHPLTRINTLRSFFATDARFKSLIYNLLSVHVAVMMLRSVTPAGTAAGVVPQRTWTLENPRSIGISSRPLGDANFRQEISSLYAARPMRFSKGIFSPACKRRIMSRDNPLRRFSTSDTRWRLPR